MAAWMRIYVDGWPAQTRIKVVLREGSPTGTKLSGDVKIVARKGDDKTSDQSLGAPGDLIANVVNGRWDSAGQWNYNHWAGLRFNRLVAQYQGQESYWTPEATEREPRVPTSISKIHVSKVVEGKNLDTMKYALTWTIVDQYGKPIAGTVSVVHRGKNRPVTSKNDRPGVCVDVVRVKGRGKEYLYTVVPHTGEPKIETLEGPEKQPMAKITDLLVTSRLHATDKQKMVHLIYWTVVGSDGKVFAKPAVSRLFGGVVNTIDGDEEGLCGEDNVEVIGSEAQRYEVFIPGNPHHDARKYAMLPGRAEKPDTRTKIDAVNRFKVGVDGDRIIAKYFSAVIPLDTFDEFGTPCESKVEVILISGRHVTLTDARDNADLGSNVRYCETTTSPGGSRRLGVTFKGQTKVTLQVRHPASGQSRTFELVYEQ